MNRPNAKRRRVAMVAFAGFALTLIAGLVLVLKNQVGTDTARVLPENANGVAEETPLTTVPKVIPGPDDPIDRPSVSSASVKPTSALSPIVPISPPQQITPTQGLKTVPPPYRKPVADDRTAVDKPALKSNPFKRTPPVIADDLKAAVWVIALGGKVQIHGQTIEFTTIDQLPKTPDSLREVDLYYIKTVTDQSLSNLSRLSELTVLNLSSTAITDEGLVHLIPLTQLQSLNLKFTEITDAGLIQLKALTQLKSLDLEHTKIGDAGLRSLRTLTRLKFLYLDGTLVTENGVLALHTEIPNCQIYYPGGMLERKK